MSITPHSNFQFGSYENDRNTLIKQRENAVLDNPNSTPARIQQQLRPHFDNKHSLAIGYGLDLLNNSLATINDFLNRTGVLLLSQHDVDLIITARALVAQTPSNQSLSAQSVTALKNLAQQFSLTLPNEVTAENILKLDLEQRELRLDAFLARHGIAVGPSQERVALMSLYFNSKPQFVNNVEQGNNLIGPKLLDALRTGNRAEAWFEIRYDSNKEQSSPSLVTNGTAKGIATRRYAESNLFGLYDGNTQPLTELEARNVLKVAARHQFEIAPYEAKFRPVGGPSISQALSPAVGFLITHFGAGQSLQQAFVAFGLGGDPIQGAESNDLLLGDIGNDILIGGGGDDLLRGEEGKDVYVYNSGDGNDLILDTDGQGIVVFDHQMLQGGLKKANESVYTSLDGEVTYQRSGSDLVVNGTLTIKDWQEGQFGIRLKDVPADPEDNAQPPGATRSQYLKVDHYVQVGNLPDGTPIFEPVYADFFDNNANNTTTTADPGRLEPPIGDENNLIFALGGNDTVVTGAGDDQIHGGDGGDNLTAGAGHDFVYGENGNDTLAGNAGDDHLYGGIGNDSVAGATGIDWLYGGEGEDTLDGGEDNDQLLGEGDDDTLLGDKGDDRLLGGDGDDDLDGGKGDDYVDAEGGTGKQVLSGGTGKDIVIGGDGRDWLFGDTRDHSLISEGGDDWIDGGDGDDGGVSGGGIEEYGLIGGAGSDTLFGGAGDDWLFGDGPNNPGIAWNASFDGRDYLDGGTGDDELQGGGNDDILVGGVGNDRLFGDSASPEGVTGHDFLYGDDGSDLLQGMDGNDVLFGGTGNDSLWGDSSFDPQDTGEDFLDGGEGDDFLAGGTGDDIIAGGSGDDTLYGTTPDNPHEDEADTLLGESGDDVIFGQGGADTIIEGEGNDTLIGDDTLFTNPFGQLEVIASATSANDTLDGGVGDDRVYGSGGNDTLSGSEGNDLLMGDNFAQFVSLPGPFGNPYVIPINPSLIQFYQSSNEGNDVLDGGDGNDVLIGEGGNDTLFGGSGDDYLIGDHEGAGFNVAVTPGHDTLDGGDGDDTLLGGNGDNVLFGGAGNDALQTGAGNSMLDGGDGDDVLISGDGIDRLDGGDGNDTLNGGDGANVLIGGAGNDRLQGAGVLDGGAGNDELTGFSGSDRFMFGIGYGQDTITTLSGAQDAIELGIGITTSTVSVRRVQPGSTLSSVDGTDLLLILSDSGDQLAVQNYFPSGGLAPTIHFADGTVWNIESVKDRLLTGTGQTDTLQGHADRNDTFNGSAANEVQVGLGGNDTFVMSAGRDVLLGGLGNDTYQVATGLGHDVAAETGGSSDSLSFTAGITPASISVLRSHDDLVLYLNTTGERVAIPYFFANSLQQVEVVRFADGTTWDALTVAGLATATGGTEQSDTLIGTSGVDHLFGLGGDDTLTGASGPDQLVGGEGDDTYVVDDPGDAIVEYADEGTDTINSSVSYALPDHMENLTLTGTGTIDGIGNALDNVLTGNSATNNLTGSAGNDTYVIGIDDTVVEQANDGIDTVQTDQSYTLGTNVENLTLTATGSIDGTGNVLDNVLTGNSGANVLTGGAGDDTYVMGSGDTVVELANEGVDTVQIDQSYTLGANVENLTLIGTGSLNGTGNALDNVLTGNSGTNVLTGGAGNDTYVVGIGDTIVEQAGEGIDTVATDQNYALGANVEHLTLTGTANLNGTGDALDNVLTGNSGANVLDGGIGADSLVGGIGNDTYVVDQVGDAIVELPGEGIDTVQSSVSYALSTNVENLTLTGTSANDATGNALDNVLTGNSGANVLTGGVGNDTYVIGAGDSVVEQTNEGLDTVITDQTYSLGANVENLTLTGSGNIDGTGNALDNVLSGNSGSNVLAGGAGKDTYLFGRGSGSDAVIDTDATAGNIDFIQFDADVAPSDITAARTGDHLVLSINGTTDQLTIQSFFASANHQVELFTFADGTVWDVAAVTDHLPKTMMGTAGQDTLYGGGGADLFDGGAGNDQFAGYDGNDTYRFGIGSGHDTIRDFDSTAGNIDTVELGAGITPGNLTVTRSGNDLVLSITGTNDRLTLSSFIEDSTARLEQIRFADGTTWDADTLRDQARVVVQGTAGNDFLQPYAVGVGLVDQLIDAGAGDDTLIGDYTGDDVVRSLVFEGDDKLIGGEGSDRLFGGGRHDVLDGGLGNDSLWGDALYTIFQLGNVQPSFHPGNDMLYGREGNDFLDGGGGDDILDGGSGNDSLLGGTGQDQLLGGDGVDSLQGGAGDDRLEGGAGDDTLFGDDGSDILDGGAGDDTLFAGVGSDTYIFGRGFGQDTIFEQQFLGDVNTVQMASDVLPSDISVGRIHDGFLSLDLVLSINGTSDQLIVEGFFNNPSAGIQFVLFSDGTVWNADTLLEMGRSLTGTTDSDFISGAGFDMDETIEGLEGDDILSGRGGADFLIGGDGNDTLDGGTGSDVLQGGAGHDHYILDSPFDVVMEQPGEGIDLVTASFNYTLGDTLENLSLINFTGEGAIAVGNALDNGLFSANVGQHNVLDGLAGNDTLSGTLSDVLIGGSGDDHYFVFNFSYNGQPPARIEDAALPGEGNDLYLGLSGGVSASALQLNVVAGRLQLAESVLFSNFDPYNPYGPHAVETYTIDYGGIFTYQQLIDLGFQIKGTATDDLLLGTSLGDHVTGGAGNDELRGGPGNDTYHFSFGDGIDTIMDVSSPGAGNVLKFGEYVVEQGEEFLVESVLLGDVDVAQSGDTLEITIGFNGDGVRLANFDPQGVNGSHVVSQLVFSDGLQVDVGALLASPSSETNDVFVGTGNNDLFYARGGNDTVNAGDGNDAILGGAGDDALSGEAGNDQLSGGAGDDSLHGGQGDDVLAGGIGHDTYLFNSVDGMDVITDLAEVGAGNLLILGTGFDSATAQFSVRRVPQTGESILLLSNGIDEIQLSGFNLNNPFGPHAVESYQFADNVTLNYAQLLGRGLEFHGTEDPDSVQGAATNDRMVGLGGVDALIGGEGDDILIGGQGDDYLEGDAGSDTFLFNLGDGSDFISEAINPGDINRVVLGPGITQEDVALTYSDFQVTVNVGAGGDSIQFSRQSFQGLSTVQFVDFADGSHIVVDQPAQPIVGTTGDDFLFGTSQSELIQGLDGNDTLNGDGGDDTLEGGLGNDTLVGQGGNNTYRFNLGDGIDTISDVGGLDSSNRILFGPGIVPTNLTADLDSEGLLTINIGTGGDVIRLSGFNPRPPSSSLVTPIIEFSDGQAISILDLLVPGVPTDLQNGDILVGSSADDVMDALGGNDFVAGGAGNDSLIGGAGNDTLLGEAGDDVLDGGAGFDVLRGGSGDDLYVDNSDISTSDVFLEQANQGIDTVQSSRSLVLGANFEDGGSLENLTLTGALAIDGTGNRLANVLIGNNADNRLDGREDADTLIGHAGDDSYVVDNVGDVVIETGNEGTDLVESSVSFTLSANVERLTLTEFSNAMLAGGNDSNNVLIGNSQANLLDGGLGADILAGGSGDDTYIVDNTGDLVVEEPTAIVGGEGGSTVFGGGTDSVRSSVSMTLSEYVENLTLTGAAAIDGTGNELANNLIGNSDANVLSGGGDNDTFAGGGGTDVLRGGTGNDIYLFNVGNGMDTIEDLALPGEGNALVFGPGISPASLSLGLGSLVIRVGTEGDEIHLSNFNSNDAYGTHAVEAFRFADGTALTYQQLIDHGFDLTGTTGDDTITGTNVVDRISGLAGNDELQSGEGNDVLTGGLGTDTLRGEAGDDQYRFNLGDGVDTIEDGVVAGAGNRIVFGAGIVLSDLNAVQTQNVLQINVGSGGDAIRLTNFDPTGANGSLVVQTLEFSDGSEMSLENLLGPAITIVGTDNADVLVGTSGNDGIDALAGDDTVYANAGDDLVLAGAGNDVVSGDEGADTIAGGSGGDYLYGGEGDDIVNGEDDNDVVVGDAGNDVLSGGAGNDVLNGGAGADQLHGGEGDDTLYIDAADTVVTGGAGYDVVTVLGTEAVTVNATAAEVELVVGSSGNDSLTAAGSLSSVTLYGGDGQDQLTGGDGHDVLVGEAGHDTLTGGLGNDVLNGGAGDDALNGEAGHDTFYAGAGADQVNGGDGEDSVSGDEGADTIAGGSGGDYLYGGDGDDVVNGEEGNDVVVGEAGEDVLHGGVGNDVVVGGTGNDTYLFNVGDGMDTISDNDSTSGNNDSLLFGGTINPLDVVLSRQANDLRLAIHGTSEQVLIENWYLTDANHVETVQAGNGEQLLSTQVEQLIQAMAGFTQQSGLTWDQAIDQQPQDVQAILAASWQ